MTVSSTTNRVSFVGNGVSDTLSITYPYLNKSNIVVHRLETDGTRSILVYGQDYTIADILDLNNRITGGTLTFTTAPAVGVQIVAIRQVDFTQETDYRENDIFPAETHETALDKLTMQTQELKEQVSRSVKADVISDIDPQELVQQMERIYTSIDNIDINADHINDINTNAENIIDINNLASIKEAVVNTSSISNEVVNVSDNMQEVIDLNYNKTNIDIAAGINEDITKVANINDKVSAVADNETNINTVVVNIDSVKNTSEHMDSVIDAPNQAANAAESATRSNVWAEGTDEQVQAIGGQHSAKGWADIASEGADKDLGNLTPTGENHFTNKNMSNLTEEGRLFVGTKGYSIDNTFNSDEVVVSIVGGKLLFYKSLADNNTGHALSDTAYWKEIIIGGVNGMAGIEPSIATNLRIEENGTSVILKWNDPADTYNKNGQLICAWKGTRIVKKLGEYPVDENDGETVVEITERDKYAVNGYTDVEGTGYYYKAFPYSAHGVFCRHDRNCFGVYLFGYVWDTMQADPATAIQYPENVDNTNYRASYMNKTLLKFQWGDWLNAPFLPKPCALKRSGTVDYYLNENDYTLKADGGISDVANSNYDGNFMMEWDTVYRKKFKKDNYIYCYFSNKKLDNDYECWSTKKSDGTYANHFYTAIYQGTSVNNCLRSYSSAGKCWGATGGAANERTQASANGTGWDIRTASDSDLIIDLYILMFKHLDSQKQLGFCTTSSTALTSNCGQGNQLGMFYGVDGGVLKFFGMENWYSHRWEREVGLINRNGVYYVKHTKSAIDGSTATSYNLDGTGYKNTGLSVPVASQSYIYDENVYDGSFLPRTVGGSATTYTCDGMWSNNGQVDVLVRGGSVGHGSFAGVFCFYVYDLASISDWTIGVSLSYHLE